MASYIGKTISLISTKGIRYVGTLDDINGESATVSLRNVRSMGSEGRMGDPTKEIPAGNQVYEYVVFRGSDVQDLDVLDDTPAPVAAPIADDPAIIQTSAPPVPSVASVTTAAPPAAPPAAVPAFNPPIQPQPIPNQTQFAQPQPQAQPQSQPQQATTSGANREPRNSREPKTVYSVSEQPKPLHTQSHHPVRHQQAKVVIPDSEFDFESNNAKFHKEEIVKEVLHEGDVKGDVKGDVEGDETSGIAKEVEIPPPETFYNKKSSFFDNISSAIKDKAEGVDNRSSMRWGEEKKLNIETFGQTGARTNNRGRYRGRRGGGGYRGRGNNNGERGNYRNYNNGYNGYNGYQNDRQGGNRNYQNNETF